jgi:hypothetical protein
VRAWQEERSGPILLGRGDRFGMPQLIQPVAVETVETGLSEGEDLDD